jgi:uncharacterized protein (UPF0332 family)
MSLETLLKTGSLRKIDPNRRVIENALAKSLRDLKVSETLIGLEEYDWAYTTAYTAMHTAARALMNKMGYRPSSRDGHVAVVKFLEAPEIGSSINKYAGTLDRMRRTRHRVMYDEYNIITEKTAGQGYDWAMEFLSLVEERVKE